MVRASVVVRPSVRKTVKKINAKFCENVYQFLYNLDFLILMIFFLISFTQHLVGVKLDPVA